MWPCRRVYEEYVSAINEACRARIARSYMAGVGFGAAQGSMFYIYALLFWYGATLIGENRHNSFIAAS